MEKKEAMKILKDFHDKSALFSVRTALDTVFPEFCESEDDKIKQRIIKLIKMSSGSGGFALHKWEADEMLAWLKKQDEQKSKWSEEDEELCQDTLDVFEALGNGLDPLEDYHKLYDWMRTIKQRLEEQQ